jgi:polyhydroxyalkanoate synthesis regulator phasin
MADEQHRSGIGGIGDGIRTGFGILNAFREAIEETLQEAVDRGDLSPDRARRAVKDAAERIQLRLDEVRDRIDLVSRREFDELREEVEALRGRVARLEGVPRLSDDPGPAGDVTARD